MGKVKGPGLAIVKKKIRDNERLLKKEHLPANVRVEHERALAALQDQLQVIQLEHKKLKYYERYKKIRFFERKKAERHIKQLEKRLGDSSVNVSEKDKVKEKLHKYRVDLKYIKEYPPLVKYVSLYAEGNVEATEETRKKIWREMEERLLSGKKHNLGPSGANNIPVKKKQTSEEELNDEFFEK
ncbi:rRNA processing protein [Schizosaccharomyces cryophilus OY26]|uniref:rRNA-processing protein EFG1 n=1 Tax=Schizosaccharomyces cryophilus (strain OY26 / ATCC MYA-4695 / CBS 11777 / NBRC 106824 / NRRL Y48691) TaxID=653667 RepID=S9VY05_SCHCR|nr:rRNA processing protein [Schizosaccharomyces cryophilus OY26]EPY52488.1 rRNA processing protein [Schizosaccharomyces cryophilus OY26]